VKEKDLLVEEKYRRLKEAYGEAFKRTWRRGAP